MVLLLVVRGAAEAPAITSHFRRTEEGEGRDRVCPLPFKDTFKVHLLMFLLMSHLPELSHRVTPSSKRGSEIVSLLLGSHGPSLKLEFFL